MFFDLYSCSDDRSHVRPPVLLGVRAQQRACCQSRTKEFFTKKKISFHQSSYFLGITQGKVICNCTTLCLGSIPLVNFINQQKEHGGIFLYQEEICVYFSPKLLKGTVAVLCMECRIFGQCQHEILLLDKTSGS